MFRILRSLAQRLIAEASLHGSPSCIAGGMAIGAILGLIPWDNLVSACLILAVFALPVNQVAAVMTLMVTVGLHSRLAPFPNAFGAWILSSPTTLEFLRRFSRIPLVPWLRLNNTMVMGGLSIGLITVVPNWMLLQWWVRRASPMKSHEDASENEWAEIRNVAGRYRKGTTDSALRETQSVDARRADVPTMPRDPHATEPGTGMAATQAERESPTNRQVDNSSWAHAKPMPPVVGLATLADSDAANTMQWPPELPLDETLSSKTLVRETWIEVVRLRSLGEHCDLKVPEPSVGPVPFPSTSLLLSESNIHNPMIAQKTPSNSATGTSSAVSPARDALGNGSIAMDSALPPGPGLNHPCQQAIAGHGSTDALRYLLRHLAANRVHRDGAGS